jgi:hypothetical protein
MNQVKQEIYYNNLRKSLLYRLGLVTDGKREEKLSYKAFGQDELF